MTIIALALVAEAYEHLHIHMRRVPWISLALPLFLSLAACSGGTSGQGSQTPETPAFQPTVPAGTPVYVNRAGQWVPGSIVRQTSATTAIVHYEGMPADWDEDVAFERLRAREAPAAMAPYKPGEVVLAKSQNRLFVAEIVQQVDAQSYRIHYAGYGPEAVENAAADRLQRQFAGATTYPVGTAVTVDAGGPQPYAAKVIAVVAADQWFVRLDGLGPEYAQLVGADKIRPAAAAPSAPAATTAAPASAAPATTPAPATSTAPATTAPATKTAPATTAAAPAAPPPLKVGDAVLVLTRNVYHPGKLVGAGTAAGSWRVRVEGQSADEEVAGDRVVAMQEPLKGVKYKAGQLVFVEWHGVWAPGKVVKEADAGNYKVRVDGSAPGADEIVQVKRLRPR